MKTKKHIIGILLTVLNTSVFASPATPHISWLPAQLEQPGSQSVSWNMWWGENGDHWNLNLNNEEACSDTLLTNGNQAQSGRCDVAFPSGHTVQLETVQQP